ncbi:MAG: hypothetical protein HQK63_13005 [Desulfamplus sp.]|nr:hypothetical protein [Desulfamplus sp.]
MTNQDAMKFFEIMTGLAENYQGSQLSEIGLKMRFEALKEFTITQISKASTELIKMRKNGFMPTVGEIIEVIETIEGTGCIAIEDQAEIQAGVVLDFLRKYGRLSHPEFQDTITNHLMTTRWKYYSWASTVEESEIKWWQKDFVRAYKAYAANESKDFNLLSMQQQPELRQLASKIGKRF